MNLKKLFFLLLFPFALLKAEPGADILQNMERQEWQVSPGVTLIALTNPGVPCRIRMVKFDFSKEQFRFDLVQGKDSLFTADTLGGMAETLKKKNIYPIAGLNADFFNIKRTPVYGNPIGISATDGMLRTTGFITSSDALYETEDGKLHVGTLSFQGRIQTDSETIPLARFNADPSSLGHGVILYTADWTGPMPGDGVKIRFQGDPAKAGIDFTISACTEGKIAEGEKLDGSPDCGALVGYGSWKEKIGGLNGALQISAGLKGAEGKLRNAVRVWVRPLKAGKIESTSENMNYPRSIFGLGPKVFVMFVADARQPIWSIGIPSAKAAEILKAEGCTEAGQFDGGGSTTLWVRGIYVNRGSDGHPRRVSNAIFISSGKPLPELKVKLPSEMK